MILQGSIEVAFSSMKDRSFQRGSMDRYFLASVAQDRGGTDNKVWVFFVFMFQ